MFSIFSHIAKARIITNFFLLLLLLLHSLLPNEVAAIAPVRASCADNNFWYNGPRGGEKEANRWENIRILLLNWWRHKCSIDVRSQAAKRYHARPSTALAIFLMWMDATRVAFC